MFATATDNLGFRVPRLVLSPGRCFDGFIGFQISVCLLSGALVFCWLWSRCKKCHGTSAREREELRKVIMQGKTRLQHSCQTLLELHKLQPAAPLGPVLELSVWAWGSRESACCEERVPETIRRRWLQHWWASPLAPTQTLLALPGSDCDRCPSALGPSALGPSTLRPSALGPSALGPSALGPSALGPSTVGPSALQPIRPLTLTSTSSSSSPSSPLPRREVVRRTSSLFSFKHLAAGSHPTLLQARLNRLDLDRTSPDQPTAARPQPVQMFLHSPSVPLVTQEVRQALESHLRRKQSQKLWGFPSALLQCQAQLLGEDGGPGGPGNTGDSQARSYVGRLRSKMAARPGQTEPGQTGPGQIEPGQTGPDQIEAVSKQVTLVRRKLEMKLRVRFLEVILGQLPRRVVQSHQAALETSANQPVTSRPRPPLLRRQEVTSVSPESLRRVKNNLT